MDPYSKREFPPANEIALRHNPSGSYVPARVPVVELPHADATEEGGAGGLVVYWYILRRRKTTVLTLAFLCGLAALLYTLPQTPVYQAKTSLEVQSLNDNFLDMGNVTPTAAAGSTAYPDLDIQTELVILGSRSTLNRALAKFKSEPPPATHVNLGRMSLLRTILREPQLGPDQVRNLALTMAATHLKIAAVEGTRIITVTSDSIDPNIAAQFLNTLSNEFIEQNMDARLQTSEQTGEFLGKQLEDFKIKLEKADEDLQSYAASTGLIFTSEKDNIADDKLKALQDALSKAETDRVGAQSRYEIASTSPPESLPDVVDDASLRDYQMKLTELRQAKADLLATLTPQHPKVLRVQAMIDSLTLAMAQARTNILNRIKNDYDGAKMRESLLRTDYMTQSRLVSSQTLNLAHYNILKREADTLRQLYDTMLQKVKEAGVMSAMRATNIRVVDPAIVPLSPYKPSLFRNTLLGLLVGLMLGVAFVLVREREDRTIQAPGDMAFYLNVPELGVIPADDPSAARRLVYGAKKSPPGSLAVPAPQRAGAEGLELVISDRKPSLLAESFRATLNSILFSGDNGDRPRVIVITSAKPSEGKTTVATNLALSLAEIKRRVLLIDGDLRRPRVHNIFHISNDWGLRDLLIDNPLPKGMKSPFVASPYTDLFLLPVGQRSSNIASLLHSPRLAEVLARARGEFDTIIIDSPPMLHISDARVIARQADGVVLVVRSNVTTRDTAVAAARRFMEDGTRLIGTVLNGWNPKDTVGYGYGYDYKSLYYSHKRYYGKDLAGNNGDAE